MRPTCHTIKKSEYEGDILWRFWWSEPAWMLDRRRTGEFLIGKIAEGRLGHIRTWRETRCVEISAFNDFQLPHYQTTTAYNLHHLFVGHTSVLQVCHESAGRWLTAGGTSQWRWGAGTSNRAHNAKKQKVPALWQRKFAARSRCCEIAIDLIEWLVRLGNFISRED
jgi:hypothetical protein